MMPARRQPVISASATIDSLGEKAVARAHGDMFGRLIRRDLSDLNAVHSGQFVSNFISDATLMRDALTQGVAAIALELVQLVFYIGYVMISDWQLGLLAMLALPGVAWAMERLGGSMRRAATRGMQETGDLAVVLSEAMDGRRVIKAYNLEDHSVARVEGRLNKRLKTLIRSARLRAAAAPMTDIFAGLVIAVVLFFAGYQTLHGDLTLNTFAAFIVALLLAQQPVRNLSQLWPTASAGLAAASRMFAAIGRAAAIHRQQARRGQAESACRAAARWILSRYRLWLSRRQRSGAGKHVDIDDSRRQARSPWWGRRAAANPLCSICSCVSMTPTPAASSSTARIFMA